MKAQLTAALITTATLPLVAACGSQPAAVSSTASPPAPARQAKATPSGPQGYQVASTLERVLKHKMNRRARKAGYPIRASSVTCVEQGRQKATCLVVWRGGADNSTVHVVISADGQTFVSR